MKYSCIDCGTAGCSGCGARPPFCTTDTIDPKVLAETMAEFENEKIRTAAVAAAEVEAENYMKMTRLEETMEFARKLGAKKLGIACCAGLLREGRTIAAVFRSHGFEVYGVICKAGMVEKAEIGAGHCTSTGPNMCNPVLQAKLLNAAGTDLNVLVGLCVGHDSLFYRYSDALVTTLIAKDRVLGHNPAAAVYQADQYYRRVYGNEKREPEK